MRLDELIAQITNPQEFTRLCNSVFTDVYPDSFQVIDGTRGDNGNDGYVASERRMLAIYSPIKPEQKTDAGYLHKIRSDLAKAIALKREGRYEIETWTFVTPRKLSDDVVSEMRRLGRDAGIFTLHQESTFLANELYRRSHLLKGFPELQAVDLGMKIDELAGSWRRNQLEKSDSGSEARVSTLWERIVDGDGHSKLNDILSGHPTKEGKTALKALAYGTTDLVLEINVILALFRWFVPTDDDRDELLHFADRGIQRAQKSGRTDVEAMFHAHKVAMFTWELTSKLAEAWGAAQMDLLVSLRIDRQAVSERLQRLQELEAEWRAEATSAIELLSQGGEFCFVAGVAVALGTSLGQVAHTYRALGNDVLASFYLAGCKKMLLTAKDIYSEAGDELGATNVAFNIANQIRFHGAEGEALTITKSTIMTAEKHGDRLLLQKARWLQHTLETGKVPDYLAGERREWVDDPK
ncbi:MAG: hypothetical protein ABI580_06025 [Burkholderiaceae bacterium]